MELEKLIAEKAKKKVDLICEENFRAWKEKILFSSDSVKQPEGLKEKLTFFLDQQKHLFFRNYREKIVETALESLSFSFKAVPAITQKEKIQNLNFNESKDRIFLEAYLSNKENCRAAAMSINVAKSTFHDWVKDHQELIESEKRKSLL